MAMKSKRRIPSSTIWIRLCALLMLSALLASCVTPAAPVPAPTSVSPAPVSEFPSPGPNPVGLAWDGSHLWVMDGETRLLYQIDPATGKSVQEFKIEAQQPQGLAWDGNNLWVADQKAGLFLQLDPKTAKQIGSIPAPKQDAEGPWSITGLTWDGQYLWVAISAGWCSSFKCIDPKDGKVVTSFFPQCNPRGLASDGKHLWTIAYNGTKSPSKLDQRLLSKEIKEMAQSQKFIADLQVTDPTALAYGDGVFWVMDRAAKRIVQLKVR